MADKRTEIAKLDNKATAIRTGIPKRVIAIKNIPSWIWKQLTKKSVNNKK